MKELFDHTFHKQCLFLEDEPANEIQRFLESLPSSLRSTINFELLRKANLVTELERIGKKEVRKLFKSEINKLIHIRDAWLNFNPQNSILFEYQNEFSKGDAFDDLLASKCEAVFYLEANIKFLKLYLDLAFPQGNFMTDFYFHEYVVDIHDEFKRILGLSKANSFKLDYRLVEKLKLVENGHDEYLATPARLTALLYHAFGKPKNEKIIKVWLKQINATKSEHRRMKAIGPELFLDIPNILTGADDSQLSTFFNSISDKQFKLISDQIKKTIERRKKQIANKL